MHHSDRGIQQCCDRYQEQIQKYNILTSTTESYDSYSNAVSERVNGVLKDEFELEKYADVIEILKLLVEDSVEVYNNE